ncbi:pentapeptide repeat-containing protein [Rhizobium laguerreae]|uniref:pentapeptide repeat-containing protein n=1 Tax=Rhizobium laguerreae TaxID=1076926 RepID=UPI001FE0CD3C|nr:pentapeptide repeat-containing protein [Rhizobium laguerreae]
MTKARFTDTNLSEAVFDDITLADARFNNFNLPRVFDCWALPCHRSISAMD